MYVRASDKPWVSHVHLADWAQVTIAITRFKTMDVVNTPARIQLTPFADLVQTDMTQRVFTRDYLK